jgi:transposase-like protein
VQTEVSNATTAWCMAFLEEIRWGGVPVCPYCRGARTTPLVKEMRHHCNRCNTSFSVTSGTFLHKSHVGLPVWFRAMVLLLSSHEAISVRQLARAVGVHPNTAWYMAARLRKALREQRDLLVAILSALETGERMH